MRVTGIDASAKMLARLQAKDGGELVHQVLGDFAELEVPGRFDVVVAFSDTFTNLTSQHAQRDVWPWPPPSSSPMASSLSNDCAGSPVRPARRSA
jgi:hypothetical protein